MDKTIVRQGDTHDVTWTVEGADLTGATMTGYRRLDGSDDDWDTFTVVVDEPGASSSSVRHTLTGDLAVGKYRIILKADNGQGRVQSIPTEGTEGALLIVIPNAD